MQLHAFTRLAKRDARGAHRSTLALLRFGQAMGREPTVLSCLIGMSIDGTACGLFERGLYHVDFSDSELFEFRSELGLRDYIRRLRNGMQGDRVLYTQLIAKIKDDLDFDNETPPRTFLTRGNDLDCHLRYSRLMLDTVELPWPDGNALRARLAAEFDLQVADGIIARWTHPISTINNPIVSAPCDAAYRQSARISTTDTGLALELFCRRHGDFPERLDQLVPDFLPAVPEDPFDGRPLRYVRRDDACVIYSIGLDQTDDGGVEEKQSTKPDITFTVRKPRAM